MDWKKVSVLTLSSAIAFGGIAPVANAAETVTTELKASGIQQGAASSSDSSVKATEDSVSMERLVTRIKELFPKKFGSAVEEDFRLEIAPYYPEEEQDIERYRISYFETSPTINPTNASFEFVGEDLELSNFYYNTEDQSDAPFPPKVSEEEAAKLAEAFINKINPSGSYQLSENQNVYYNNINLPLTRPIEYRFTFDKLKNDIPIQSQSANVTVLGNGEITQFNGPRQSGDAEFEPATGLLSKDVLLEKVKEDLDTELQYMIRRDYNTGESTAYLTYRETPLIRGVSAKDGKYNINGEFVKEIPEKEEIKLLATDAKAAEPITRDEAKELAKKLLATDEEGTTLQIEGVVEREIPDGTKVYEIRYMYRTGNSGFGSSIQIKKDSGELLRFHASRNYNPNEEIEENISSEEALEIAVDYINDYAYTNVDEYAYPAAANVVYRPNDNQHRFTFPRVKNGLIVAGDNINVGISKEDGSLLSLNIQRSDIDEWPSIDDVVSKETALEAIKEKIDLTLYYVDERENGERVKDDKTLQYKLSYLRDDNYNPSFYNAVSGKWESSDPYRQQTQDITVTHPWAEEELNFMINNNIINVEDPENFDADQAVTKGEALEILSKSLTRIYQRPYAEDREESPFTNIDSDHPLYEVIKRSAEMGILDTEEKTFDVDEKLTRENLAFWYIRALGLDPVAKRHDIFNYDFDDVENVSDEYRGYVVLADSLGLLNTNNENKFLPQNEVSYALLAVTNLRLAQLIASEDFELISRR